MNTDKLATGLGSVVEWYDFALYAYFAPIIAQLYFPSQICGMGLVKTFGAFAVGFFARPVGALLFGSLSDKYGRRLSLKITPILMTGFTILFAILPTFQQIGFAAPVLLVVLRILQGLCIGGEFTNNIIYLCETTKPKRRYFFGSLGACTGSLGIFFASTMATICYMSFSSETLLIWGWRIAFAIAIPLGVTTWLLRKNLQESKVFLELSAKKLIVNNPIITSLRYQWRDYVIAMGLTLFPATSFYYVFMFLPNYISTFLNFNASKLLGDNSLSLFARLCVIPIIGILADRVGGIKILRLATLLFMVLSYPLLQLITRNSNLLSLCLLAFAMMTTLNAAATPGILICLLKPDTRCTILSFTFNFCFGVFGGITPMLCLMLVEKKGSVLLSACYLILTALITFIATFFFRNGFLIHEKTLQTNS